MYRTEISKDEIVVTRRTDGKTIAYDRDEFAADTAIARRAAIIFAKLEPVWTWG